MTDIPSDTSPVIPSKLNWLQHAILHFTPSWFSVNMGTGIVGIVIHTSPYKFTGEYEISTAFYILNIILFSIFALTTIVRYYSYPWIFKKMLLHPSHSLFIGTLPMGLATIVNATVLVAVPAYGHWAVMLAWVLWWVDVLFTVLSVFGVTYVMFNLHALALNQMTAAWLLPVVPAVVAAASGAFVASVLNPEQALITLVVSWILWGVGLGLSTLVLAFYFHRLALYKLPDKEVIVSAFLPLGPLGQGSFGIIQMGVVARILFNKYPMFTNVENCGDIIYICSLLCGLILWGFGVFWLVHGITSVLTRSFQGKIGFNMGLWGFIFPLGVFTSATIALANEMPSTFFAYLSEIFVVSLVILWLVISVITIYGLIIGKLLISPCLTNINGSPGQPSLTAVISS